MAQSLLRSCPLPHWRMGATMRHAAFEEVQTPRQQRLLNRMYSMECIQRPTVPNVMTISDRHGINGVSLCCIQQEQN